jgi:hypothetical protein
MMRSTSVVRLSACPFTATLALTRPRFASINVAVILTPASAASIEPTTISSASRDLANFTAAGNGAPESDGKPIDRAIASTRSGSVACFISALAILAPSRSRSPSRR